MALSPRLEFRQTQSLTMTPQLLQSIRLLQLSHLELNEFVDAELLSNPLLERSEATDTEASAPEPEIVPSATSAETDLGTGEHLPDATAIAETYDTAVENLYPDQGPADRPQPASRLDRDGASASGEAPDLDQYVAARPTLSAHLEEQASFLLRTPADRLIAQHLIHGLDDTGYCTLDLAALADQLGTEVENVEAVLLALQGCEPLGVFARSVAECLALQLAARDRLDPLMQALLAHLDLLARHDMAGLQRAIGCDREDLNDMLAEIRQLDPRPGLAFDSGPAQTVVPDVYVRPGPDGAWLVELNSDVLPRVLVNRSYYTSVTRQLRDPAAKSFMSECLATANWLTKSLDQRAQTILKVAAEITRQQDGFLTHGIAQLKPMTLKLVAEAIDMHESTVSRVTSHKYLATPRGLFEMKYFFTTAIAASDGGEEHSAEVVRHRIRQLIEAEAVTAVLSDDTIAALLKQEQGIEVARRTVAKYREGMNIPSSVLRRRQKKQLVEAG